MTTRRYRPRRGENASVRSQLTPPRMLELRRQELLESDVEDDMLEFLEEYDASGHRLRLERPPR